MTSHCLRMLPSIPRPTYTALSSLVDCILAVSFDSDYYLIRINTNASRCMVNTLHLSKDLKLGDVGEVEGIKLVFDIKGTGTFKANQGQHWQDAQDQDTKQSLCT
jgi:hypothetical protein